MSVKWPFELIDILLVEDNPADVRLVREVLSEGKMVNRLVVAEDGREALAILQGEGGRPESFRPGLILLDLNLPGKGGLDLLREIKADGKLRDIPVAVLTSSRSEEDVVSSYELLAGCYITKPMDLEQFIKVALIVGDFRLAIVRTSAGKGGAGGL